MSLQYEVYAAPSSYHGARLRTIHLGKEKWCFKAQSEYTMLQTNSLEEDARHVAWGKHVPRGFTNTRELALHDRSYASLNFRLLLYSKTILCSEVQGMSGWHEAPHLQLRYHDSHIYFIFLFYVYQDTTFVVISNLYKKRCYNYRLYKKKTRSLFNNVLNLSA